MTFHLHRGDGTAPRLGVFHAGSIARGEFIMTSSADQARRLSRLISEAAGDA
jgi:hypothetical protein